MKNPNGYGCVRKLSGKRRKPFGVYVTTNWELVDGKAKQIQKNIGYYATRQEAMIALAEYNKNPIDIANRNITFKEVYDILYKQKFSKMKLSAKNAYTMSYNKCEELYKLKMINIKTSDMQQIIDKYQHKSKSLQNNLIKLFHAMFRFCIENEILNKDYSQYITVTSNQDAKEKIPFSKDEIFTLWNNIDWCAPYNKVIQGRIVDTLLIMIYTGLRISELLDLCVSDIHLEERYINLRGTKTKAAKRIVPIHKDIIPLLHDRILKANAQNTEYLFFTSDNEILTYIKYRKHVIEEVNEYFNMNHTAHECRHTFASIAIKSNMNTILLKKILGHASNDITVDIYTHTYIEDLISEIDKFTI